MHVVDGIVNDSKISVVCSLCLYDFVRITERVFRRDWRGIVKRICAIVERRVIRTDASE